MRSGPLHSPIETDVAPAQGVGDDEHDVRSRSAPNTVPAWIPRIDPRRSQPANSLIIPCHIIHRPLCTDASRNLGNPRAPRPRALLKGSELDLPYQMTDLWPQLFSDVNCIALWISSEKILTRLYSVLHWFHKRLEANVKNPRENRCFHTIIVFSFGSFYNSNKCTVLWKIAASLITCAKVVPIEPISSAAANAET